MAGYFDLWIIPAFISFVCFGWRYNRDTALGREGGFGRHGWTCGWKAGAM